MPSFVDFRVGTGLAKALIPRGKRLLCRNKFQLNCSVDRDMDVSTSAMVDGAADCVNGFVALLLLLLLCLIYSSCLLVC